MRREIKSAVNFLANLLRNHSSNLEEAVVDDQTLEQLALQLRQVLSNHYRHHWHPQSPNKGSAYRCVRINHKLDPLILKAGQELGLTESILLRLFPKELTLWIDPGEVNYRIGEDGTICALYESKKTKELQQQQQQNMANNMNNNVAARKTCSSPPQGQSQHSQQQQQHGSPPRQYQWSPQPRVQQWSPPPRQQQWSPTPVGNCRSEYRYYQQRSPRTSPLTYQQQNSSYQQYNHGHGASNGQHGFQDNTMRLTAYIAS